MSPVEQTPHSIYEPRGFQTPVLSKPIPNHWKIDEDRPLLLRLLFRLLCVIACGHTDIECLWAVCCMGESEFTSQKDRLITRTSTITVVVKLALYSVGRSRLRFTCRPGSFYR